MGPWDRFCSTMDDCGELECVRCKCQTVYDAQAAEIARLTAALAEAVERHDRNITDLENANARSDTLRAENARLRSALGLARPYIVQATKGLDPPAPALTVLDAALAGKKEPPRKGAVYPRVRGVGRMFDNDRALLLMLASKPTDDDLRAIHDVLKGEKEPT